MTNESNAFKLTFGISATIKRAAVKGAHHTVVVNESDHCHRVNRAPGKEAKHFLGIGIGQATGNHFNYSQLWCFHRWGDFGN